MNVATINVDHNIKTIYALVLSVWPRLNTSVLSAQPQKSFIAIFFWQDHYLVKIYHMYDNM